MKKILRIIPVIIAAIAIFAASTLSWLIVDNIVPFPTNFGGSTKTAYFAGGDGSNEDPYIIKSPVHFYNLAWLQYLGYFNLGSYINNGRAQSFFKLDFDGDNLNLSGLALPPIGTREYPFIGYFNGNGKTISNFTVSNSKTDLIRRPLAAIFSGDVLYTTGTRTSVVADSVDILGLFGVTGNFNSFLDYYVGKSVPVDGTATEVVKHGTDVQFPGQATIIKANEFYSLGMNVRNFYVDKIRINSVSSKVLVGLAAGYVGSTVENVGVYRSKVNVKGDSLSGVSNVKRASGATVDYDGVISNYSIVGDYDSEIVGWTEAPSSGGTSPGEDSDWGGSIDMQTLARRINYMMAATEEVYYVNNTVASFKNDNYNLYATAQRVKNYIFEYGYNPGPGFEKVGTDANLLGGTYKVKSGKNEDLYTVLPINIDKTAMKLYDPDDTESVSRTAYKYYGNWNSGYDIFYPTTTSTSVTFSSSKTYREKTSEIPYKNTGYIVGLGSTSKTSSVQGAIQINIRPRTANNSIKGSFKGSDYNSSSFALLTFCKDGKFRFIKDPVNTANWGTQNETYNGPSTGYSVIAMNASGDEGPYLNKEKNGTYHYQTVRQKVNEAGALINEDNETFDRFLGIGDANKNIYGLSFNNGYGFGIKTLSKIISYDNGQDTEKLVSGAINFNVKKPGIITTIVGAYYGDNAAQNAFSLHKVDKSKLVDGNPASSGGLTRVEKIYECDGEYYINTEPSNSDSSKTVKLCYDRTWYGEGNEGKIPPGYACYIEIPVPEGDYVIGFDNGDLIARNGYLMYLDIGANGSGSGGGGGETQTLPYIMQSVDFVAMPTNDGSDTLTVPADNGSVKFPNYRDVGFKLGTTADVIYFRREDYDSLPADDGEIETIVYYYRETNAILVTVFPTGYGSEDDGTNAKWE